jgi:hypothetical protein
MTDYEVIVLAVRHNIHGETTDAQAIAFAQEIRRAALEEAAKTCDALSTDYNKRRRTSDNPTYMEGKSDGAEACASALYRAIRALSQKDPQ